MRALIAFLIAVCLTACVEFEENFVNVDPEPKVAISSFVLRDASGKVLPDTFQLYGPENSLSYQFEIENNDTVTVSAYVDNSIVVSSATGDFDTFEINTDFIEDGIHTITFNAFTNTGNGSLADVSSHEGVKWTVKKYFIVNSQVVTAAVITSAQPENGRLKVEWQNQGQVPAQKKLHFTASNIGESWEVVISDPEQTSYVDSKFFGGRLSLRLETLGVRNTDKSESHSIQATFPTSSIQEFTSDEFGGLRLTWNKSRFYQNTLGYSLLLDNKTIGRIMNANDTVAVTRNVPFGTLESISVRTYSNVFKSSYDTAAIRGTSQYVFIGEEMEVSLTGMEHGSLNPENGFCLNPTKHELYILKGDVIERMVTVSSAATSSDIAVSSDGTFVLYAENGLVNKVDRQGNLTTVLNTTTIYGQAFVPRNLTLGADRYLVFYQSGKVYIYDIVTKTALSDKQVSSTNLYQTPDGKFIIESTSSGINVHEVVDGMVDSFTRKVSLNIDYIDVSKGNKIIDIGPNSSSIYDPYTNTITQVPILNSGGLVYTLRGTYDPITGLAGAEYQDWFIIIDPHQGKIVRMIYITRSTNSYRLYNGIIYHNNGYNKKLNLKLP